MYSQPSHAGLASLVQSRGRGDDTMLVHMTPSEVHGLHALAFAHGGMPSVNPDTGLYEFGFLSKILPTLLGIAGGFFGLPTWAIGLGTGAIETARTGDLGKGILAGLGAYGGGEIGSALSNAGTAAATAGTTAATTGGTEVANLGLDTAANASRLSTFNPVFNAQPAAQAATQTAAQTAARTAVPQTFEGFKEAAGNVFTNQGGAGSNFLKDVGFKGFTAAAAPMMAMDQPTMGDNQPEAEYYVGSQYKQTRNPNWTPYNGQPYFLQSYTPGTYSKTYSPPFSAAGGGIIPAPNPSYPQAAITRSNYAAPLQYNRPQELLDGYEPKINPFTGEERFDDGGLASLPRDTRTTGPATMEQFLRNNPQPAMNRADPTGALKSYYTNLLNPDMQPPRRSTSALEDYMRNMNIDAMKHIDADQIQKTKPVTPTKPTTQSIPSGQNVNLGDLGMYMNIDPMTGIPTAGYSNKYKYDPVTRTYKTGAELAMEEAAKQQPTQPTTPTTGGGFNEYLDRFSLGFAEGGSTEYAAGGKFLRGPGDGMSDDIKANIAGRQEARLADGEFVIPADVVSHLGNGSSEAGSRKLYKMMANIRKARTGRKRQAPAVKADRYLPK